MTQKSKTVFDPDSNPYFDGIAAQLECVKIDLARFNGKKAKLQSELDGAIAQGYLTPEQRVAAEKAANQAEKERRKKAASHGGEK